MEKTYSLSKKLWNKFYTLGTSLVLRKTNQIIA